MIRPLLKLDSTAGTARLTENVRGQVMRPADQVETFAAPLAEDCRIEDIAADFFVTPLVIQRRLKLATVSARLTVGDRAHAPVGQ